MMSLMNVLQIPLLRIVGNVTVAQMTIYQLFFEGGTVCCPGKFDELIFHDEFEGHELDV